MAESPELSWLGLAEGEGEQARFLLDSLIRQTAALASAPTDTHAVNALVAIRDLADDLLDELDEPVEWEDDEED